MNIIDTFINYLSQENNIRFFYVLVDNLKYLNHYGFLIQV